MIKNVLLALAGFVVIGLLVLWFLNGGPRRMYEGVRNFSFDTSTTTSGFTLPWQIDGLVPRIEPDLFLNETLSPDSPESQLAQLQQEYKRIEGDLGDMATVGTPSPQYGQVTISEIYSDARSSDVTRENIVIEAHFGNTGPISLSGWSLQSAVTKNYVPLPGAASPFWMGAVNTLSPVSLAPGHSATIASGISPVGVSFRENICTGYLAQFQSFNPPLPLQCPTPSSEIELSSHTLEQFGPECVDAVAYIPTCEFPKELPNVSVACRAHLQTTLSYNGCVNRHASDTHFAESSWRLYVGSSKELWNDRHDALRLLDAEGRVVDVYMY